MRRQEKVEHLNTLIRELEVSIDRNRPLDSREIWKRDHFIKNLAERRTRKKVLVSNGTDVVPDGTGDAARGFYFLFDILIIFLEINNTF